MASLGLRFQTKLSEGDAPHENRILLRIRLNNRDAATRKKELGILGTNLIYAAYQYRESPEQFVSSLGDNIPVGDVTIDKIKLEGDELKMDRFGPALAKGTGHGQESQVSSPRTGHRSIAAGEHPEDSVDPSFRDKAAALGREGVAGTFAEIGGGLPTARIFLDDGDGSHAVSRVISEYAQEASVVAYANGAKPPWPHVSRQKVEAMLSTLHADTSQQRLRDGSSSGNSFTLAASSGTASGNGRAWIGLKYQTRNPQGKTQDNQVIVHLRLLNRDTFVQGKQMGMLGTNLIDAAFHHTGNEEEFIRALHDHIPSDVVIDDIHLDAPDFDASKAQKIVFDKVNLLDARTRATLLADLELFNQGAAPTLLFGMNHDSLTPDAPNEALYRKEVILVKDPSLNDSVTNTPEFISARSKFRLELGPQKGPVQVVHEIKVEPGKIDEPALLKRIHAIWKLGHSVILTSKPVYEDLLSAKDVNPKSLPFGLTSVHVYADGKMKTLAVPAPVK